MFRNLLRKPINFESNHACPRFVRTWEIRFELQPSIVETLIIGVVSIRIDSLTAYIQGAFYGLSNMCFQGWFIEFLSSFFHFTDRASILQSPSHRLTFIINKRPTRVLSSFIRRKERAVDSCHANFEYEYFLRSIHAELLRDLRRLIIATCHYLSSRTSFVSRTSFARKKSNTWSVRTRWCPRSAPW